MNRSFSLQPSAFSLLVIAFIVAAHFPVPAAAYSGCDPVTAPVANAGYEQQVVELVNSERAKQNLPPYKRVSGLDDAARYHAVDMAQDRYFQHDSYDGGTMVCSWSTRVRKFYSGSSSLGENIAYGYGSPQQVMNGWMNSSGHRANIMSTGHWEIGVGYATGNQWVQDFGRRSAVFPVVINSESASTDTRSVSLYVYGRFAEVRIKNDNEAFGGWQPFANTLNWTLASGGGTKTVTVELRGGQDGATTRTASDTITLTGDSILTPALGGLPASLSFSYSLQDRRFSPPAQALSPANSGSNETLSWSVTSSGGWFTVSPASGTTPGSFTVTPSITPTVNLSGLITVTVTSPTGVTGSPKVIPVSLNVVNGRFATIYLPNGRKT